MKTKNNTQKTENSQLKKMGLRGITVLFILVLISLTTVTAQDFWKQLLNESSYGKMAVMRIEQSAETEKADAVIEALNAELEAITNISMEALECEAEPGLQLEAWMTDETFFSNIASAITEEADEALKLEEWMISNPNFNNQPTASIVEIEQPLEVEAWMINETLFSNSINMITEETDEALKLEEWMISNAYFNNEVASLATETEPALEVESWMTNENFFKGAERLTASGAEQEIGKYAQKQINQ